MLWNWGFLSHIIQMNLVRCPWFEDRPFYHQDRVLLTLLTQSVQKSQTQLSVVQNLGFGKLLLISVRDK